MPLWGYYIYPNQCCKVSLPMSSTILTGTKSMSASRTRQVITRGNAHFHTFDICDILATYLWSVTLSWLFFLMSAVQQKGHWHNHNKFRLKQNKVSVTSSTVMITGETQTVVATITCLVTLCATNSWSVTWSRHFLSVIITIVMGHMPCVRTVPRNKMIMFSRSV